MLTRIEISGFKSFEEVHLDLNPFTVIVGSNASGKSNFFDALRFLSRLASHDLPLAVRELRGDPSELFRRVGERKVVNTIKFAVEVLLPASVEDAFGQRRELKHTRIRYDVEIERRLDENRRTESLYVKSERAAPIKRTEDKWLQSKYAPSSSFVKKFCRYASGGGRSPFLETLDDKFQANQDGVQGRPRPFPISRDKATATVLSRVTTANEFPHLFALRQELEALMFLQLEAAAEREPSDAFAPDELLPNGSNIAKVLSRIQEDTSTEERPLGNLVEIRNGLSALIPGTSDLRVERDTSAGRYRIFLKMKDESEFSSGVLSDGTLRVMALVAFLNDPRRRSVLLFEEPENGIHHERIVKLVRMLRESTTDIYSDDPADEPLFQIILNTHSTVVLQETAPNEIVAVDVVSTVDPATGKTSRRSRMRSDITGSDQLEFGIDARERALTKFDLEKLLKQGPGAS